MKRILILVAALSSPVSAEPIIPDPNLSDYFRSMTPNQRAWLLEYGKAREHYDRMTFPSNMPKAGEPYDLFTGNRIPPPAMAKGN